MNSRPLSELIHISTRNQIEHSVGQEDGRSPCTDAHPSKTCYNEEYVDSERRAP